MQDYKENLKTWADWALTQIEGHPYPKIAEKLTNDELREMLAVLAGYLAARGNQKGRELLHNIKEVF